jgi:hypothetical protein
LPFPVFLLKIPLYISTLFTPSSGDTNRKR